jgi:dephospho-CoA kinase
MLHVGLTGNVASGKSTVARLFAEWGATVIDADSLVRDLQQPGSEILAAIARRFGESILLPDGSLDRAALRRKVMKDPPALLALNGIVHPAVRARRAQRLADARRRGDAVVVSDVPLLFEVLDPKAFDLVVLVHASDAVRRRRLIDLRGLPEDEADRLLAAQLPSDAKRNRSDVVIDNEGTLEELKRRAWEAWTTIQEQAKMHG